MSEYLYGIRDGKPVSISDIPVEMAGLKCGCVCPICGRPFQACSLQGKVKRYFRHDYEGKSLDAGNTCNVHWANESGLHKMAKHVIENERKIAVKALEIPLHILKLDLPEEIQKGLPPVFEFKKAEVLECQEVELEQSVGDFKPDVVIKAPDKYLIEIFVSHKVSEEKVIKAAAQDEPMLEIDLSSFVDEPISYEQLREIIVDSFEHREWVFHPDYAKALEAAKKHYMSFLSVQLYFQELEAREQKERKLTRLLKPDNYKNELTRLSNNKAFFQKAIYTAHNDFVFYREHKQVPFFVDIPITGEMIFQCDRRIWQGTIFNRWIYNRKANKKNAILIGDIFKELYTTHKIPVDWDLSCPLYIVDNEQSKKEYDLRKSVVNRYLYYLERLGFIYVDDENQWATVREIRTITPPNQEFSRVLRDALRKVEVNSPIVDNLIDSKILSYYTQKAAEEEMERKRERQAQEEQKRQQAERAAEEARKKEEKEREESQRAIMEFDYTREDAYIEDLEGNRMGKCIHCGKIDKAMNMKFTNKLNLFECMDCLRKRGSNRCW